MQKFPNLKNPYQFLATLGGIGLSPLAPGTVGSIFAWIAFVFLSHFMNMIPITIIIIVFAVFICEKASISLDNKDHKAIVIDELAGMWVALIPVLFITSTQQERTLYAVIAFISFRFFDILKPFPISYLDTRFKNGFGIVVDDLAAGIFAGLFTILITILLT